MIKLKKLFLYLRILFNIIMFSCLLGTINTHAQDNQANNAIQITDQNALSKLLNNAPNYSREEKIKLQPNNLSGNNITLRGTQNTYELNFSIRQDEMVTQAVLQLDYAQSPTLDIQQSHLKIYLNDELMGVASFQKDNIGKHTTKVSIPLDPKFIRNFNTLKIVFVGDVSKTCRDLSSPSIWVDLSQHSTLDLKYQNIQYANELSYFPSPFFDENNKQATILPIVFTHTPSLATQKAAAILSSWFGSKAKWRDISFPVYYDAFSNHNSIVFATNDALPTLFKDHPHATGPTIEIVTHPKNQYKKILLITGRNDNDLITAAHAITQGNILLRGQKIVVEQHHTPLQRKPYDAPYWVNIKKPITLSQLIDYPDQLKSFGSKNEPIVVDLNIPPDLYTPNNTGIILNLKYRYTQPILQDQSRLIVSLNKGFIEGIALNPANILGSTLANLPIVANLTNGTPNYQINMPAEQLKSKNTLEFNFIYSSIVSSSIEGLCQSILSIDNFGTIDGSSTLDFSNYYHFISLPNLSVYGSAGFPFSRMADLSETIILLPSDPEPAILSILFNQMAAIGATTGYPVFGVELVNHIHQASHTNKDIIIIGYLAQDFYNDDFITIIKQKLQSWLLADVTKNSQFMTQDTSQQDTSQNDNSTDTPMHVTQKNSSAPLGIITEFQSPFHEQRSVIAILGNHPNALQLLQQLLSNVSARSSLNGAMAIIRESGINTVNTDETYEVGHLPLLPKTQFYLGHYPGVLALFSIIAIVLISWLLWAILRLLTHRRLKKNEH